MNFVKNIWINWKRIWRDSTSIIDSSHWISVLQANLQRIDEEGNSTSVNKSGGTCDGTIAFIEKDNATKRQNVRPIISSSFFFIFDNVDCVDCCLSK